MGIKTALSALFACVCVLAQSSGEPPSLVRLIRSFPARVQTPPYADAHAAVTVLGLMPVSGPSETWLVEMHDSFASIENIDKALGGTFESLGARPELAGDDVLSPSRALVALYRPAWSYRPEEAMRLLPKAHYFQVSIFRNHGDEAAFGEVVRSRKAGLDSINLDRPDIVYEVVSGAPSGMYLILAPLTGLRALDEGLANRISDGRTQETAKKSAAADISREHLLFRIEPRMSYVSEEFAASDPDFWGAKR